MNDSKIAIIDNGETTLYNFRRSLIEHLIGEDYEVYAFAPFVTDFYKKRIEELEAVPVHTEVSKSGLNPFADIKYFIQLFKKLNSIQPDIVLSSFAKPNIYGMIASRLCGIKLKVAFIEGAGSLFIDQEKQSLKRRFLRKIIEILYKISLGASDMVVVLNKDDKKMFINKGIVDKEKVRLLPGIGVDIKKFSTNGKSPKDFNFIYVGRMLKEKGVKDLISAAKLVHKKYKDVSVALVGGVDSNPSSLTEQEIRRMVEEANGAIKWTGFVDDVKKYLKNSEVFVLPSYYREGLPRSTQEAMAMGKPIITTDVPGCRETVVDGENGFWVPDRDPEALAEAMIKFIEEPHLVSAMGKKSRTFAEEKFDQKKINKQILSFIKG